MSRSLAYLKFFYIFFILACAKQRPDLFDFTFEIENPEAMQMMNISEELINSFASDIGINATNTMAEPTSLSQLSCVGVLVGYSSNYNLGTCYKTTGEAIPVGKYGGLVPYSHSASTPSHVYIDNLAGNQWVNVYAVGFKTSDSSCITLSPEQGPNDQNGVEYSEPYIIGRTQLNLESGKINDAVINSAFSASEIIDDCRGSLFSKDSVLKNELVAYWNFDSNNVNLTRDLTDNYDIDFSAASQDNNNGRNSTRGIAFNTTTNQQASVVGDSGSYFSIDNKLSLSMWLKVRPSLSVSAGFFLEKIDGNYSYKLSIDTCSANSCTLKVTINSNVVISFAPVNLNVWKHLVVAFDKSSDTIRMYINGLLVGSGTYPSQSANSATALKLGSGGSVPQNLVIDNFGVWGRPLRLFEINALYYDGSGRDYPFEDY